MGAHSVPGHHPGHTLTAAAGVAAALVTTATTGVLTGGTALATDGSNGPGHGHSHRHQDDSDYQVDGSDDTIASQPLCDVLGDVPLGVGVSCPGGSPGGDSSSGQDQQSASSSDQHVQGASVQRASASPAPAAPAPAPKPGSAVPAKPQVLKIGG
ncbi:MAG TPA: hypothetical protein VGH76_10015 [Actinomycetospora sp.]|jgi:hypothetical protein|uniref:hypothetical protein n=1 Tax=Actinomycetospora sp. TaxID=1872135 RepID=UPI002F4139C1